MVCVVVQYVVWCWNCLPFQAHSYDALILCQWSTTTHGGRCGELTSCMDIPNHLVKRHNLPSFAIVICQWQGCWKNVRRECLLRHILEHHLEPKRRSAWKGESTNSVHSIALPQICSSPGSLVSPMFRLWCHSHTISMHGCLSILHALMPSCSLPMFWWPIICA